jgi:hypothetical protein
MLESPHVVSYEKKAALKPPQSKRWRDCRTAMNLAPAFGLRRF